MPPLDKLGAFGFDKLGAFGFDKLRAFGQRAPATGKSSPGFQSPLPARSLKTTSD